MSEPVRDAFVFQHGDDASRHYWYLPHTERPPGATTQWLAFGVRLGGFVSHTPASHFAIVLRAHLGFDDDGRPVSIAGRGMTFGDTSLAQPTASNRHALEPGFGGARGAQIESFWVGGNFLFRETALLPDGLRDGVDYRVRLEVDDARGIRLQVETGGVLQQAAIRDRVAHPVPEDATGVLIALGRGPHESGAWRADFGDLRTGWR